MTATLTRIGPETHLINARIAEIWLRATFPVFEKQIDIHPIRVRIKPLKLGVHEDILNHRLPRGVYPIAIKQFLAEYTKSKEYLYSVMQPDSHRFDLKGEMGDEISPAHRQLAASVYIELYPCSPPIFISTNNT
jgi:sRNA-binding protein